MLINSTLSLILLIFCFQCSRSMAQKNIEFGLGLVSNTIHPNDSKNFSLENLKWVNRQSYALSFRYRQKIKSNMPVLSISYENKNYEFLNKSYPSIKSRYDNKYLDLSFSIGRFFLKDKLSVSIGLTFSRWLRSEVTSFIPDVMSVQSAVNGFEQFGIFSVKQTYQFRDYDNRNLYGYNLSANYFLTRRLSVELSHLIHINHFKKEEPKFRNKTTKFSLYFDFFDI